MFRNIFIFSVTIFTFVSGCGANLAPVNNITNAPVSAAMRDRSIERVRAAIVKGLAMKGWIVEEERPGVVIGTVQSGGHSATVQINYNQQAYSIMHRASSPGLQFDGVNIHRRYNHWIRLLNESIQRSMVDIDLQADQIPGAQNTPADTRAEPAQPSPSDTQAEPAQPSDAAETAPEGK